VRHGPSAHACDFRQRDPCADVAAPRSADAEVEGQPRRGCYCPPGPCRGISDRESVAYTAGVAGPCRQREHGVERRPGRTRGDGTRIACTRHVALEADGLLVHASARHGAFVRRRQLGGPMWAPASALGHHVTAELQEGMSAYEWRPDPKRPHDHDRVEAGLPARHARGPRRGEGHSEYNALSGGAAGTGAPVPTGQGRRCRDLKMAPWHERTRPRG
jgi:hypothetical protein